MTSREVEVIVRGVIVDRALPFDLLSIGALQSAWDIRLRHHDAGMVSLTIPDGRAIDIRRSIQEQLEEQS